MLPELYNLNLENWQLFATLTFESRAENGCLLSVPRWEDQVCMLFAFLRGVARGLKRNSDGAVVDKIHFHRLLWTARGEPGETYGRDHFHVLIAGLPLGRRNHSDRWATKEVWARKGGGFAEIRAYEPLLPGVAYVLKGLHDWSYANANAYEMRKFGGVDDQRLIVGESFLKKWGCGSILRQSAASSGNTEFSGLRLSDRRKLVAKRTKDTPAYQGGLAVYGSHPAGVSFVR